MHINILWIRIQKLGQDPFFEVNRGCEAIENGFNECFNSVIVNVRHKPLLTMLKDIRVIVIERMNKMKEISRKWYPGVCPNIKKRLEWLKEQKRSGSEGFTVDEGKRTCSCMMWQLSGIPCVHATKSMYSSVLQPKPRKMPGMPRKKRIRSMGEGGSSTRVSKVGGQANCSNCNKPRHNKASCTEPVVEQTPKPKGVVGRPRNKQSVDDLEDVDVVQRGSVRDEGDGGSKGGARGSRGRGGATRSRGGATRSRGGASVSREVIGGFSGGSSMSDYASGSTGTRAGGSAGASGSRGRGASGSGGAMGQEVEVLVGLKGNMCQLLKHKKDKVRRRLRLLDLLNGLDCKMNQSRHKMNHNRVIMNPCRHKMKTRWSRHKNKLR
ncbi:multidrug resistance-associated protein 5 [Tanacetum coccineum]